MRYVLPLLIIHRYAKERHPPKKLILTIAAGAVIARTTFSPDISAGRLPPPHPRSRIRASLEARNRATIAAVS